MKALKIIGLFILLCLIAGLTYCLIAINRPLPTASERLERGIEKMMGKKEYKKWKKEIEKYEERNN